MANDDMLKRIQKRLRNAGYELETILTDGIKEDYINNAFNSAGVFKPKIDILGDMGYFEIENTGDIEDQEGFVGENRYYLTLNFNPHIWPQNEETRDLLFNDEVSRQQRFENNIKFELKVLEILKKKGILKSSWTVGEYGVDSAVNFNPLYEGSAFIYINDFTPRIDACSHENLSIKTMEVLNGELLLTLDCDKCGKRTSTSASLNQGWEAEDLNTWAQQELSSHGQNVSFKNWAKKEVKSHGNIDLVDWAKHEKQSHTKKYGVESFSLDSKKADIINMEEPVIEEPSFIPDGDGRAIGQQNSSINLSPLHAESSDLDKYRSKCRSALLALHEALYDAVDGMPMTEDDIEGLEASHPIIVDAVMRGSSAESEAATYSPSSSPDMVNEIQTSPTNESPQLFNASNTFNVTSALGISGLVVAALSLPMLYSSAKSRLGKSAEEKRKASGSVRRNHTQVKNSEYSVGQVNPVEAEGQQDIHGAEGITNPRHAPSVSPAGYPSKTLKMW